MAVIVPENALIVQSDYTVLLEAHSPRAGAAREALAPFAELVKSPEHVHTYRLTPISIWNARSAGLPGTAMIAALREHAKYPIPDNVVAEVGELAARYGRVVLTKEGDVFDGSNVENSSYSLTICAERNAVFQAVHAGKTRFRSIAIASDDDELLTPCGACRQVLSEFSPTMEVILTTVDGHVRVTSLDRLFPMPADLKKLARVPRTRKK